MYRGPLHAFRDIIVTEGWRTFYKGSGTILVGVPATALYFATYEKMKRLLPGMFFTALEDCAFKGVT